MRVQRRSLQLGLAFKIQLEVATSPAQHFENCGIAFQFAVYGMGDLALDTKLTGSVGRYSATISRSAPSRTTGSVRS